ncbi:S-4TM family putative pore-forming effector [Dietzia kunjamensis]|uniref:S-4TM family putative pore-forming effector n=1 Tax=Dietzia kunjamensis TaxID=322509 RepID=UPI00388DE612
MTDDRFDYEVPTSAEMLAAQNATESLRLLVAQRALYSKSKRWMGLRWIGMAAIAILGPILSVFFPGTAVVAGAVAGLWIFLGRTTLSLCERRQVDQAASLQELFDFRVFGMPNTGARSTTPPIEEINLLSGDDTELQQRVNSQKLRNWYPMDEEQDGLVSVAIAQRANASYADRLLRTTARVWTWIVVVWAAVIVSAGLVVEVALSDFILAMVLPLLPAFLDIWEYRRLIARAADDRRDLAAAIEQKLADGADNLQSQDLLVWQARLFDLRRDAPQVPDFIYWLKRKQNERAMKSAAHQISSNVRKS